MAKGSYRLVPPDPIVQEREITLVLNVNEAETLRMILNRIGGTPATSRRKYADAINAALNDGGVKKWPSDKRALDDVKRGKPDLFHANSIYFEDTDNGC